MRATLLHRGGSDLWPYELVDPVEGGRPMGHESTGVVGAVGNDVRDQRGFCRHRGGGIIRTKRYAGTSKP